MSCDDQDTSSCKRNTSPLWLQTLGFYVREDDCASHVTMCLPERLDHLILFEGSSVLNMCPHTYVSVIREKWKSKRFKPNFGSGSNSAFFNTVTFIAILSVLPMTICNRYAIIIPNKGTTLSLSPSAWKTLCLFSNGARVTRKIDRAMRYIQVQENGHLPNPFSLSVPRIAHSLRGNIVKI